MKFVICSTDRLDCCHFRSIKADSFSDACNFVKECIKHDLLVWDSVNLCDESGLILVRFIKNGRCCNLDPDDH